LSTNYVTFTEMTKGGGQTHRFAPTGWGFWVTGLACQDGGEGVGGLCQKWFFWGMIVGGGKIFKYRGLLKCFVFRVLGGLSR